MLSDETFEAAEARAAERRRTTPWAVKARYDRRLRRIVVRLSSGMDLTFAPRDVQALEHATPEQLADIEVSSVGYGLHWPGLDEDVYVPSLLQGVTGSKAWMARRLGEPQAA